MQQRGKQERLQQQQPRIVQGKLQYQKQIQDDSSESDKKDYGYRDSVSSFESIRSWSSKRSDVEKLKILMVTEKNSISRAVAYALGGSRTERVKEEKTQFFQYEGKFVGQLADFTVTATNGHLFDRDFDREYSNRQMQDPQRLFKASTRRKPVRREIIRLLKREAKGCDCLFLWLDNDREGENICFEVIDVCSPFMRNNYTLLRAKFSSTTTPDIRKAYRDLNDVPDIKLSDSVDARQVIDLKVGCAFSRFQTTYFNQKYPQLRNKQISFGPCQTPTLGFCVARHKEIESFVPKKYYPLVAHFENSKLPSIKKEAKYMADNIYDKGLAMTLVERLKFHKYLLVVDNKTEVIEVERPQGLNTVALLQYASTELGISPQQTMNLAQELYSKGFISYPRTESTQLPDEQSEAETIVENLQKYKNEQIADYIIGMKKQMVQPIDGVDRGDHPPICPTGRMPDSDKFQPKERQLFEYIVSMYFAAHSTNYIYEHTTLEVQVPGEQIFFQMTGDTVIENGFSDIAPWLVDKEEELDTSQYVTKDNKVKMASISFREDWTKPPEYLTESDLIGLMEKNEIGTDASMAGHIHKICQRKYVKINSKKRTLIPTKLGIWLADSYQKIDPDLVSPYLRSEIEAQCNLIALGDSDYLTVVNDVVKKFEEKFVYFKTKIHELDELDYQESDDSEFDGECDQYSVEQYSQSQNESDYSDQSDLSDYNN